MVVVVLVVVIVVLVVVVVVLVVVGEVVVVGVHSAKFDREDELYMLKSAVRRYDFHHAVVNDCHFDVWNSLKLNNWPTVILVGPD